MSELVRLAVVGAGLIGKRHIMTILHCNGVKLTSVVDPSEEGRKFAEQNHRPWFSTIEEMLAKDKPDGVILATPNNLHLEHGLQIIDSDCPVLIEKPLAVNSKDAKILVDASKSSKVPILVGHHRRHNPIIQAAYQIIQEGELGQIRSIHANFWLYKPDNYFDQAPWRKASGAGPVSVNLVHDIDLIRHLCGEVSTVYAQASASLRGYDNEDVTSAILRMHNDALCTISVSDTIVAPWSWELTSKENPIYPRTNESCYLIGGTHGSLSLPDLQLWKNNQERSWWNQISATNLMCDNHNPLKNQILQFAKVIKQEEEPLVSGEEGLRTIKVMEAILSSSKSGQLITF